jgi:hypothetical protein
MRIRAFSLAALVWCLPVAGAAPSSAPSSRPAAVEAWAKDHPPAVRAVRTVDDLAGLVTAGADARDQYGGWSKVQLKATGFFRVEKVDGRWWLVTPDGHPYFSMAMNSVSVREGSATIRASYRSLFKTDAEWRESAIRLLTDNGFNGTAHWSNNDVLKSGERRLPYTDGINFMAGYGKKRGGTFQQPGHTGYPNDCIFVFDPGFEEYCQQAAADLAKRKNDPYLLGYFSDNEMPFRLNSLDLYLKNPEGDPGRLAAEAFMNQRYGKDRAGKPTTDADRQAWMEVLAERYFSVVSAAIRRHDPNHLYLGARFHETDHRNPALFKVAGKYVDVISYNLYYQWNPDPGLFRRWAEWSGRPVIITEFYAKGDDSGMANNSGAGWTVRTQQDRGLFYQTFVLALIESKSCVGWHWLRYMDNAPDDKLADPSNRNSNKGIVNAAFVPYAPALALMKQLNERAYGIAGWFDGRPTAPSPATRPAP